MKDIKQFIKESREEVIGLRRDFHAYPELGLAEHRTGKIVADYLSECGLEVSRLNSTGVVGFLCGEGDGPTLLMRADMDALPIQEENEVAYSSVVDGVMHACGHDAHTAMLMVAAKYLCQNKSKLNGNIKFVFEPNEENAGSLGMIQEGLLENPKVDACVGVHVWSPLETRKIGIKAGPVMAGMQHFKITIIGKGGHTATPQSGIDPILVAAAVIQAVQTIQTREIDVLNEPAVIMFGSIVGGSAANIIPDSVTLEGTIRYLFDGDDESENSPVGRLKRIVKGVCETYRATHKIEFPFGHPTLVNDTSFTSFFTSQVVEKMSPKLEVEPLVTLAGEDFSEFASRVPSLFYFLGAGKPGVENFPHHHPRFNIDEAILEIGVELHVRTALEYLSEK